MTTLTFPLLFSLCIGVIVHGISTRSPGLMYRSLRGNHQISKGQARYRGYNPDPGYPHPYYDRVNLPGDPIPSKYRFPVPIISKKSGIGSAFPESINDQVAIYRSGNRQMTWKADIQTKTKAEHVVHSNFKQGSTLNLGHGKIRDLPLWQVLVFILEHERSSEIKELLINNNGLSGIVPWELFPKTLVTLRMEGNHFHGRIAWEKLPPSLKEIHVSRMVARISAFDVPIGWRLHGRLNEAEDPNNAHHPFGEPISFSRE